MKSRRVLIGVGVVGCLVAVSGIALSAGADKYTLKVPNGLAVAEFRGYESWQLISVAHNGDRLDAVLGNPAMIDAFKAGIPDNGKPFPDGAKMAKVHWAATKNETEPGAPTVAGAQHDLDFMVKDSKRFKDGGGWGYAEFELDAATNTWRVGNMQDHPPQGNDAKCGVACHTAVKNRDYVFTKYAAR